MNISLNKIMNSSSLSMIGLLTMFAFVMSGCRNTSNPPTVIVDTTKSAIQIQGNTVASLTIDGMICEMGCAKVIENKLNELDGVSTAEVNFETKTASISFDSKFVELPVFIQTVEGIESRFKVVNWNLGDD